MIEKQYLKQLINATGQNFQFKLSAEFEFIFNMLYSKVKDCDKAVITKKFEELWKKTSDEWNKQYGFRGYPALAQWLEILVEKPLTDKELEKKKLDHERDLTQFAKFVVVWVTDPNLSISFPGRYKNPDNDYLKLMIDKYCKVKEELPRERIISMAKYLRKNHLENKQLFFTQMREIADDQNQLLLTSN
jgi:hypothetical protein